MLQYQSLGPLEAAFFRTLNAFVEPMVRAGIGAPGLWPTGAIVLETTGRKTGRTFNVPVLATLVADLLVVATVRPASQWLKNLASNPDVRYWMGGRVHEATAFVVAPGLPRPASRVMPPLAEYLASGLLPMSAMWGVSFAILSRRHGDSGTTGPMADRVTQHAAALGRQMAAGRGRDARSA